MVLPHRAVHLIVNRHLAIESYGSVLSTLHANGGDSSKKIRTAPCQQRTRSKLELGAISSVEKQDRKTKDGNKITALCTIANLVNDCARKVASLQCRVVLKMAGRRKLELESWKPQRLCLMASFGGMSELQEDGWKGKLPEHGYLCILPSIDKRTVTTFGFAARRLFTRRSSLHQFPLN